jgi:hypothetical protein
MGVYGMEVYAEWVENSWLELSVVNPLEPWR